MFGTCDCSVPVFFYIYSLRHTGNAVEEKISTTPHGVLLGVKSCISARKYDYMKF